MKNKKTAYFLIPLVLLVWGMIGWKVYAAMNNTAGGNMKEDNNEEVKPAEEKIPDTFELLVNYRDPFLGNSKIKIPNSPKTNTEKHAVPIIPPKPVFSWPEISYHGLIVRNGTEKKTGFLRVNGISYFVQGGDEAGGVKVGKISKDSVEVMLGKERKIIRK